MSAHVLAEIKPCVKDSDELPCAYYAPGQRCPGCRADQTRAVSTDIDGIDVNALLAWIDRELGAFDVPPDELSDMDHGIRDGLRRVLEYVRTAP